MAKVPFRLRPVLFNAAFFVVVGCLAAHFLIDDLLLLPGLGWLDYLSADSTSFPAYAEIDHQDDLVIQAALPAYIVDNAVSSVFEWTILLEKQPPFPIFHPPEH